MRRGTLSRCRNHRRRRRRSRFMTTNPIRRPTRRARQLRRRAPRSACGRGSSVATTYRPARSFGAASFRDTTNVAHACPARPSRGSGGLVARRSRFDRSAIKVYVGNAVACDAAAVVTDRSPGPRSLATTWKTSRARANAALRPDPRAPRRDRLNFAARSGSTATHRARLATPGNARWPTRHRRGRGTGVESECGRSPGVSCAQPAGGHRDASCATSTRRCATVYGTAGCSSRLARNA